jgi:hypothetical protein
MRRNNDFVSAVAMIDFSIFNKGTARRVAAGLLVIALVVSFAAEWSIACGRVRSVAPVIVIA